jgi:hypothetical protein
MRYAIYNFTTRERTEEMARSIIEVVLDRATQCRVTQASTVMDERHLGTDWQCDHCLPPEECIHCNPAFRFAELETCETCCPYPYEGETWHVNGQCVKCGTSDY